MTYKKNNVLAYIITRKNKEFLLGFIARRKFSLCSKSQAKHYLHWLLTTVILRFTQSLKLILQISTALLY